MLNKAMRPNEPIEVLAVAEMGEADRSAPSFWALMQHAGRAVADTASAMLRDAATRRVLVLCGPGHNGGDGYVAAAALRQQGCEVTVAALSPDAKGEGDDAKAVDLWGGQVAAASSIDLAGADLIVDALFGAGLSRALDGEAAALVDRVNASGIQVLSVDVPSGVDGDTGQVRGTAIRASRTVTFFRLKPAHLLQPGRANCGSVLLADIGIPATVLEAIRPTLFRNDPQLWRPHYPVPSAQGHKYSRGHAVVVSGPMPTTGAARLAARGALRIGAGLVTMASPTDAVMAHAAHLDAIMLRPFEGRDGLAGLLSDPRRNAVVLGPGLGEEAGVRDLVACALQRPDGDAWRAVVLDADALTTYAGDADRLGAVIRSARGPVVATPHDGEFAKLFGRDAPFADADKVARARAGARRLGAVLVLKGDDTVIAEPDGRAAITAADAPWLATAGSGDVLSGFTGGLLAQGMPAFEAACAAVYLHAACGRRFGPGLISEDLPEILPSVLRDLLGSRSGDLEPAAQTPRGLLEER